MISSFVFCMFVWFRLNAACLRVVVMYMLKQCGWNVFLPVWKKKDSWAGSADLLADQRAALSGAEWARVCKYRPRHYV